MITNADLAEAMGLAAAEVMQADGDRDYMNPSNLTVQQTTAIADMMRLAAARLAQAGVGRLDGSTSGELAGRTDSLPRPA